MKSVPLYQTIYDYYKERILQGILVKNDQIPTEKDLMDMFSVSRITAKHAINMLAEDGLVVRIAGKGTFVHMQNDLHISQGKKQKLIGLILCDIDYTFGMDLLKSIEYEVGKLGYQLAFKLSYESREIEMKAIHEMIQLGVEGIIIQTVHGELYSNDILRVYLSGFPMVFIDRHMDKTNTPFVSTHNKKASYEMTKKLIDSGYKHISFISADPKTATTLEERYSGFKSLFNPLDQSLDILDLETPLTRNKTEETVLRDIEKIKHHLERHPEIDCIFAAEMYVAQLTKKVLKNLNIDVPHDMGIVTFDTDTAKSKYAYYTHIKQNEKEMGKEAVDMICSIIAKKQLKNNRIFVDASMHQGKSTKILL